MSASRLTTTHTLVVVDLDYRKQSSCLLAGSRFLVQFNLASTRAADGAQGSAGALTTIPILPLVATNWSIQVLFIRIYARVFGFRVM